MNEERLRVRASTAALVQPPPILLTSACTAAVLPRNDTLLVLTENGVLTRWHLDGDARVVSAQEIGPGRQVFATPRSNTGFVLAPDGSLVVFDSGSPAFARFPGPTGMRIDSYEQRTWLERRAWLTRKVALLGDDGHIAIYSADGGTKTIDPRITVGPRMAIDATRDARCIVLGDAKGDITVLSVDDAEPVARWHAHEGGIIAVVCTPDGRDVLTAGHDGKLRTWEIATGAKRAERVIAEPASDDGPSLAFVRPAADGAIVLVTTSETHTSHAPWGEVEESTHFSSAWYATTVDLARVVSAAGTNEPISPDGRWTIERGYESSTLRDLHAKGCPQVGTAPGPARFAELIVGGPTPYALVPHGDRIERWSFVPAETPSARPITRCTELRFLSPHVLISAHHESKPFARDAATAAPLGPFGSETWKLSDLYLAASGKHVIHSEYGAQLMHIRQTVIALDGSKPRTLRKVPNQKKDVGRHAALTPRHDRFVIVGRDAPHGALLEVRDVVGNEVQLDTTGPGFYDRAWIVSDEPLRLAIARSPYRDEPMELWDVATGAAIAKIEGPSLGARRLCVDPSGTGALSYTPPVLQGLGPTNDLVRWCFVSSSSHLLEGHASPPTCVAFAQKRALSADASAVFAWDLDARALLWKSSLPPGVPPPERLVPMGDAHVLVACGLFGPHLVLRVGDGSCLHSFRGAQVSPAWVLDGTPRLGVIEGGKLLLLDVETGAPVGRWKGAREATAWTQAAEAPYTIAVGDACGDITLLDPAP